MKTWGVLAAVSVAQFGCHTPVKAPDGTQPPMPVLLFSDGLVDSAMGESGVPLPSGFDQLKAIAGVYPCDGGHEWSVDPMGHGLLIASSYGWQSEGFWYWKSWKQPEPVNVHPACGARFKSDGWIWYYVYAADLKSHQYRLMSTDDPSVDVAVPESWNPQVNIVVPTSMELLDASHDGTVVWVDNDKKQLVVSQVRDRALQELHRWDLPLPTWAKGGIILYCKLDRTGTWAAVRVDSDNASGLMVVNTSDGKIVWAQGDWCEVLWAGNAMFRCESDSRHIAMLSLEGTPHLTEEHGLPYSVTGVGEVSPDGRWAVCGKRAPWFVPAISIGCLVLDMQTMRTYKGLSGFDRRCVPVGWLSADVGAEVEPAK